MRSLIWTLIVGCATETQTSYCEALCDWGTTCAQDEYAVSDPDTLYADCLSQTEAEDDGCTKASDEGVNAARGALLTECTDAIQSRISDGECDGFTGSIDDQKLATTPGACATEGVDAQATFNAARNAIKEPGAQLCGRFILTYCEAVDACLISELGDIPDEVWTQLGGTNGVDVCQGASGVSDFANTCVGDDLYAAEQDLTDVNIARQGARECLDGFDQLTCSDLLSGDLPPLCAASFTSTEQATGFATGLFDLTEAVRDAVQ
ncbi:MAG: hypothetical protein AAFV53_05130 [Myxococcota bacterium]